MKKQLKQELKGKLTKKEFGLLPSSYDVVGSILIFSEFPPELEKKEKLIAETLIKLHKNIETVSKKTGKYGGKFRLPKLKILAGKRSKETIHKENNVSLKLHVENVYFSPRSSTERKRIFQRVKKGEDVLVMFSGCAPYILTIAKNTSAKSITGIEINPIAHEYAEFNVQKNKVTDKVKLYKGNVKKIIPKLKKKYDRILMPLPKGAEDFLDLALKVSKKGTVIHLNQFLDENDFPEAKKKILEICKENKKKCKILSLNKCGQFSPGTYRVCFDLKVI